MGSHRIWVVCSINLKECFSSKINSLRGVQFERAFFSTSLLVNKLEKPRWKGSRSTALGKHPPMPTRRTLEIHPELAGTIAATKADHGRFVLNNYGKPYSYSGFDQPVDDWCDQAGLPSQCTAHGVRKAAAALMYENGASEAELCAIFGWKIGSRMAAYYAKKYNARRAQSRALGRLPLLGGEKRRSAKCSSSAPILRPSEAVPGRISASIRWYRCTGDWWTIGAIASVAKFSSFRTKLLRKWSKHPAPTHSRK